MTFNILWDPLKVISYFTIFIVSVRKPKWERTVPFVMTFNILWDPQQGNSYLFRVPLRIINLSWCDRYEGLEFFFVLSYFLNKTLFTCADILPIRSMLDIHIMSFPKTNSVETLLLFWSKVLLLFGYTFHL
jgi:hypothetical protein